MSCQAILRALELHQPCWETEYRKQGRMDPPAQKKKEDLDHLSFFLASSPSEGTQQTGLPVVKLGAQRDTSKEVEADVE